MPISNATLVPAAAGAPLAPTGWSRRHRIVLLAFLAGLICYLDRVNISVAALAMQDEFGWSDTTKGLVLSAFFAGYLLFQLPSGWAVSRFGPRRVMGFAILWWSLCTIATPLAAMGSLALLLAARAAMGAGEAGAFPAAYGLLGRWSLPGERTRFLAFVISSVPAGTLVALLTTGWLVAAFGWESAFYISGAVGVVFVFGWFAIVRDDPTQDTKLGPDEREMFARMRLGAASRRRVPWRALLSEKAVWALLINHFCTNWVLYVLLSWLPSFFRATYGTSIVNAGLFSAAPWLTMFVMVNVSAAAADAMIGRGVPVVRVRKLLQVTGLLGAALFVTLAVQAPSAGAGMAMMCVALGASGLTQSGFACNHLDIAPAHAGVLMSITNTAGTIPGVLGVAVTGWLIDRTGSFQAPLALASALAVIAAIVWALFARGDRLVD